MRNLNQGSRVHWPWVIEKERMRDCVGAFNAETEHFDSGFESVLYELYRLVRRC